MGKSDKRNPQDASEKRNLNLQLGGSTLAAASAIGGSASITLAR